MTEPLHGPGSATYYINQLQSAPSEAAMREARAIVHSDGEVVVGTATALIERIAAALDRRTAAQRERIRSAPL